MEDVKIALHLSLYIILVQTLYTCRPSYALEDDIVMESSAGAWTLLDSHYYHIAMSIAALYDYMISIGLICFEDDLRYWIKLRCMLWFSQFLMSLYDDSRWIEIFKMNKATIAEMCYWLRAPIEKQNTKYRLAVLVEVGICCCLYKLVHGANFLSCSEKFAIERL
jgi:hypothetical protein